MQKKEIGRKPFCSDGLKTIELKKKEYLYSQSYNAKKVISEVYASFVLQFTVCGR